VKAKYALIAAHRDVYDVTLMCRALAVAPSGFYAAAARSHQGPRARAVQDEALRVQVRATHAASGRRYGAPRVHRALRAQGTRVAKKRVARLMREDGLVARRPRRRVRTTDAAHAHPIAPNTLARQFPVAGIGGLDRVWASDITYIPTAAGWLYLAVVLDLGSRRVIGWAMHDSLEERLVLNALRMALGQRQPPAGLLHHSDRGSQYAGAAYQALLAAYGLACSMSRKGDCWDNAVVESFFATLEHELLAVTAFPSRDAARRAIFAFIEVWYNRQRQHSSLGYVSPAEYEQRLQAA
jgi:transposase InsO family protein